MEQGCGKDHAPFTEEQKMLFSGRYATDDSVDDTDISIAAGIFLYHLHYLHAFSWCPVCKDEDAYQSYYD
jgi:hypothetical protein